MSQALQKKCTNDDDIQNNPGYEPCVAHRDRTSDLTAQKAGRIADSARRKKLIQASSDKLKKVRENSVYCCQNGYFNKCLLIVCRLVFDDLNSNITISFGNQHFATCPNVPWPRISLTMYLRYENKGQWLQLGLGGLYNTELTHDIYIYIYKLSLSKETRQVKKKTWLSLSASIKTKFSYFYACILSSLFLMVGNSQ